MSKPGLDQLGVLSIQNLLWHSEGHPVPQGVRVHAYSGDVPIVQPLVRVDAQACPYPAPIRKLYQHMQMDVQGGCHVSQQKSYHGT